MSGSDLHTVTKAQPHCTMVSAGQSATASQSETASHIATGSNGSNLKSGCSGSCNGLSDDTHGAATGVTAVHANSDLASGQPCSPRDRKEHSGTRLPTEWPGNPSGTEQSIGGPRGAETAAQGDPGVGSEKIERAAEFRSGDACVDSNSGVQAERGQTLNSGLRVRGSASEGEPDTQTVGRRPSRPLTFLGSMLFSR